MDRILLPSKDVFFGSMLGTLMERCGLKMLGAPFWEHLFFLGKVSIQDDSGLHFGKILKQNHPGSSDHVLEGGGKTKIHRPNKTATARVCLTRRYRSIFWPSNIAWYAVARTDAIPQTCQIESILYSTINKAHIRKDKIHRYSEFEIIDWSSLVTF